jgi:hypothetical protein
MNSSARLLGVVAVLLLSGSARGGFMFTIEQVGNDVVTTGAGAIDLAGLSLISATGTGRGAIVSNSATVITGPPVLTPIDFYKNATGPASFGIGGQGAATTGMGDIMGVVGGGGQVIVPHLYTSGTNLSSSDTFDNTTIAGLHLTPGSYTYTSGSGGPSHTITVDIIAVPEPSSIVILLGFAGAGLIGMIRRRRRTV